MFTKLKSEQQAFEITGITPDIEKFKLCGLPEDRIQPMFDGIVCELLCEANNILNGNWVPDWADDDQWKYSPAHWVEVDVTKPTGFGLTDSFFDSWYTDSIVGERLLVGSSEQAMYLADKFRARFESARLVIKRK